jgi:hypothetical protein
MVGTEPPQPRLQRMKPDALRIGSLLGATKPVEDTIIGSCLASERITGFHTHFIGLSETTLTHP